MVVLCRPVLPLAAVLAAGADWLVHRRKPAIQFQETVVLVALAALGGLTLTIALHGFSKRPASSQPAAKTQETATGEQKAAAGGKAQALPREIAVELGKGVKLEMMLIPAGEFLMGSPDADRSAKAYEKPQHRVRITKPFYLGKYLVTQEQWEAVLGGNPNSYIKGPKYPVMSVSWDECQQFLEHLNAKSAAGRGKFQLPSQAQWEYACRAGSTTRYCFGDDASQLGEYAWYEKNSNKHHAPGRREEAERLGRMTCTGPSGSGARIGMTADITRSRRRTIRRDLQRARPTSIAAAACTTPSGTAARPPAMSTATGPDIALI